MMKPIKTNSIARTLATAYAFAAAIVLTIVVFSLYFLENTEMKIYQTAEIKNRFSWIEHSINEIEDLRSWHKFRNRLSEITAEAHGRIYFRIDSANPDFVIEGPFTVNPAHLPKHHGFSRQEIDGRTFRVYSRVLPADNPLPELILSIAVDIEYFEFLDQWIDFVFVIFLIIGITVTVFLGWKIARKSLKPVDKLSEFAASLRPDNLSARLPDDNLPVELSGLVQSFNGALERLEESYIRQAAFNSDVAHELRTPVGNLIGQTEVALSKPRSINELREIMESNLEELERLRTIINDMLFLSRADQGEISLNFQPVNLAEEIRKTADFMEVIFEDNQNRFSVSGEAWVAAEPSLLKRALTNLLNNAVEHGSPATDVTTIISKESGQARIKIINNTPEDIPATDLPNIFNRFYRVSKERRNSTSNHGLGLAIVKAIVTMHGGLVFASSQNGIVEIGFTLPLQK